MAVDLASGCNHADVAKKGQRARTFVELAAEPTWSQTAAARTGAHAVRPGAVNAAGEFFDPDGRGLTLVDGDLGPAQAQRAVDAGALVVAECCGCGGGSRGCTPVWLDARQVGSLRGGAPPVFTGRHRAPTWLELWTGPETDVVFTHGDVSWGGTALG